MEYKNNYTIAYRLEDKRGNGIFFNRNGNLKSNPVIKSKDIGLSAFENIEDFNTPSYIKFYLSKDYLLYKIITYDIIYKSIHTSEIIFNPCNLVIKTLVDKPTIKGNRLEVR